MKKHHTVLSGALGHEFQKDLELFKHFLLLLNNTSPIRNVELMWHEEREELDPLKEKFKSRVGTGDALVQLQPVGAVGTSGKPQFAKHALLRSSPRLRSSRRRDVRSI